MLSFPGSLRIFIALDPCDMRAGMNTLHGLVAQRLQEDSKSGSLFVFTNKSGSLFVFTNKRRRLLKILYWDGSGLWMMTKRLEEGTFFWPRAAEEGQTKLLLKADAFALLTDGIDMHGARPRGWYERD